MRYCYFKIKSNNPPLTKIVKVMDNRIHDMYLLLKGQVI